MSSSRIPRPRVPSSVLFSTVPALALVTAASIADGSLAPVLVFAAACVALAVAVERVAVPAERRWLMAAVFGAFGVRAALAAILVWRSLALGNGGFTTGDDIWYASAAGHLAQWLRGEPELPFVPPYWNGQDYLMTTYVYVQAAVFLVFGQHVLNIILVNSMIGALTVLLVADAAGRTFGRAPSVAAASVLALYPSVVLWSAVNLRDTLVIFFIVLTLWALAHMRVRPALAWIVVAFLGVWAEEGLRSYIEGVLLFVALLSVIVVFVTHGPGRRVRWPVAAAALFTFLLFHSGLTAYVSDPVVTLGNVGDIRVANQFGRAAFDTPPPQGGPPAPAASVPPLTPTSPAVAITTSTPYPTPPPKVLRTDVDASTELARTLAHLPAGVIHTLFAPFPWSVRTPLELAAMPEMAVWYVILGAALATLWTHRRHWAWTVPEVLFLGALLLLLSLGEGNVGTLYRHRAMAIPAVILLASPTLAALGRRALATPIARGLASGRARGLTRLLAGAGPRTP